MLGCHCSLHLGVPVLVFALVHTLIQAYLQCIPWLTPIMSAYLSTTALIFSTYFMYNKSRRSAANMAYEVFKRTGVRVEEPALSLVPDGRIALNAAAVRVLTQAGVKSVLLSRRRTSFSFS